MIAFLLVLAASAAGPRALAVEVDGLYTAQVPLDPEDPDSRNTAYRRALQQVLIRVTGSEAAAFSPELAGLFPNPARFVLQYRPGEENSLHVSLDGAAIERVLKQSGVPVWGSERPLTLVWLAVDWGQGDRELIGGAPAEPVPAFDLRAARREELRRRVRRVAEQRGIPIVFPDLAGLDPDGVTMADVWGGFHERVVDASRRQGASSVLVGRLRPADAERNRWSYYFGRQQRQWNGDTEDAVHLLADTLAGEFAFAGNAPVEAVTLTVANVANVRDYVAVQKLIDGLQMIDGYRVTALDGNRIRYTVRINGGVDRLASALDFSGELERALADPDDPLAAGPGALAYRYRPTLP